MPRNISVSPTTLLGLLALHRYRLLSVTQFARASGLKPNHVRDVLRIWERQKLLGSIGNVGLRGGSKAPKLYYLTRSGYDLMVEAGGLWPDEIGPYVRAHTGTGWTPVMAHRMATIDLLLSVEEGLQSLPSYRLVRTFHEYRRVKRGPGPAVPETSDYVAEPFNSTTRVVPDAGFVLENVATGKRGLFFIETDRGTERLTSGAEGSYSILEKFRLYERYLQNGRFADTYKELGDFRFFTLLFVTTTRARIENTRSASRSLNEKLHSYFKLATLEDAIAAFFEPIWVTRDPDSGSPAGLVRINS